MRKIKELFHGSRQKFDNFDTRFKGTGEAGDIAACWFTDNFAGARNHALYKNRNDTPPLVYRCELSPQALLADYSVPLSEQPRIAELLSLNFPVAVSSTLESGRDWHALRYPFYVKPKSGKSFFYGYKCLDRNKIIEMYKACGIHGVYDWEGIFTDGYLRGTTTIMFDFSELIITDVIEV